MKGRDARELGVAPYGQGGASLGLFLVSLGGKVRSSNVLRRAPRGEFGAAAVEFAILLPVMLLIIGGIVDFGRAFFTQIELTNAAREGARAAIVGADGEARATAAAIGLADFSAAVPPCTGPNTDVTATTQVTNFEWIVLGPIMGMFGSSGALPTTLESTAVMRCT